MAEFKCYSVFELKLKQCSCVTMHVSESCNFFCGNNDVDFYFANLHRTTQSILHAAYLPEINIFLIFIRPVLGLKDKRSHELHSW